MTNSLAALAPKLAREWHPSKNRKLKLDPRSVVATSGTAVWWRCRVDRRHTWRTSPNIRFQQDTGCPDCKLVSRSREEIGLAHEIWSVIPFDLKQDKVRVGTWLAEVDIVIPKLNLLVEYDGAYWHHGKESEDRNKTARLEKAGWRVLRVRQAPLKALRRTDVIVPERATTKERANIVLQAIERRCGVRLPGLKAYLRSDTTRNGAAAEAFIRRLHRERLRRKLDGRTKARGASQTSGTKRRASV